MITENISYKKKNDNTIFKFDDDFSLNKPVKKSNTLTESYDDCVDGICEEKSYDMDSLKDTTLSQDFCDNFEVNTGLTFNAFEVNERVMSDNMKYSSYACDIDDDTTVTIDWETSSQFTIGDAKSVEREIKRAVKEIVYGELSMGHFDTSLTVNVNIHDISNKSNHSFSFTVDM